MVTHLKILVILILFFGSQSLGGDWERGVVEELFKYIGMGRAHIWGAYMM